ncbi:MAG: hypothetical protein KIG36_05150 [Eubacteriales bacterium]|nr:hypothetical protein [Eubacteriales bacterium]
MKILLIAAVLLFFILTLGLQARLNWEGGKPFFGVFFTAWYHPVLRLRLPPVKMKKKPDIRLIFSLLSACPKRIFGHIRLSLPSPAHTALLTASLQNLLAWLGQIHGTKTTLQIEPDFVRKRPTSLSVGCIIDVHLWNIIGGIIKARRK